MYLLIDNYDSFTFNLYQAFAEQGVEVLVARNDSITLEAVRRMAPDKIVISPGPGRPPEAGISKDVITHLMTEVPILGICLGSQCIAEALGGVTVPVNEIVHGRTSLIYHASTPLFRDVPDPFRGARYHSLMNARLPRELEVTASTGDGLPMALEHREFPLKGLQFHPESFLTESGKTIIRNFIEL